MSAINLIYVSSFPAETVSFAAPRQLRNCASAALGFCIDLAASGPYTGRAENAPGTDIG